MINNKDLRSELGKCITKEEIYNDGELVSTNLIINKQMLRKFIFNYDVVEIDTDLEDTYVF